LKVYHIHTDKKFLKDSLNFNFKDYHNTIIYIGNDEINNSISNFSIICFKDNINTISKLTKLCKDVQVVVLYDFNDIKIALTNRLPQKIKIIWRFFGHELYGRKQNNFLSKNTLLYLNKEKKTKSFFDKVKIAVPYRFNRFLRVKFYGYNYDFEKSLKRVDLFLGLFKEEYVLLNSIFKNLPDFLQIPIFSNKISLGSLDNIALKDKILLGNSRNIYNNHLDLLEITKDNSNFKYILPFNYGSESFYSKKVEEIAKTQNIYVLNNFMEYKVYENLLKECSAFILNSYRQMAVGNILIAIKSGMKLYLNKKNIVYEVLKNNNFHVSLIEDFKTDLKLNNISLSKEEIIHNYNANNTLCDKYTLQDFKTRLEEKISKDISSV
jgi:dTDP-N-acetylfucosamine:lipid II N-acetylfucosaminyltransferase